MATPTDTMAAEVYPLLKRGAWGLPIFAVLLCLSTVTHQPDYRTEFAEYADYVTTDVFLVSHLVASILGAVAGIIGIVCIAILIAGQGVTTGRTLLAGALSVAGNVLNTALFGVAAFAQPAIGRAYHAGTESVIDLNADVYGPELTSTAVTGLSMFVAGAILLGRAMMRACPDIRWAGLTYAVALPAFVVFGLSVQSLQPVAAAVVTVAAVVFVRRLGRP